MVTISIAPDFTQDTQSFPVPVSNIASGTIIGTVTTSEGDLVQTYRILPDDNGTLFTMTAISIGTKALDLDTTYIITVRAIILGLANDNINDDIRVTFVVSSASDPIFTQSSYSFVVPNNQLTSGNAITDTPTINATITDLGATVTYSIISKATNPFSINPTSCVLSTVFFFDLSLQNGK